MTKVPDTFEARTFDRGRSIDVRKLIRHRMTRAPSGDLCRATICSSRWSVDASRLMP